MAVMTNSDIIDFLKAQSFSPHRDGHPQDSLVIFKTVTGDPGSPSGKLNIIKNNENI
jgi:hypothetical protein